MVTDTSRQVLINRTKADAAYDELRRRIVEGELEPGLKLDQEAVALDLGLSTTPIREALRRLEADHLVQRNAHKDVTICPLSASEARELYAVREELDSLAVMLATRLASDAELEAIRRQLPGPSTDASAQLRSNRTFHRSLYGASHNAVLIEVLESLWDRSDRYRAVLVRDRDHIHVATSEHQEIVDAVTSRDAKRAARLMREHISKSLATIQERLPQSRNGR